VYFAPQLKGNWDRHSGLKTRMIGLLVTRLKKSSVIWIQYTHVTDGRTDGYRATAKTALTHSVAR